MRERKSGPTPTLPGGEGVNPAPALPGGEGVVPGYLTANPLKYKIIKELRGELKKNPTPAEIVLWKYLRNKKTGHKIRRQHIIDVFIVDFVCLSSKVVIEVDGKIHDFQKEYDAMRTDRLKELGYEVIRFTNDEVLDSPEKVTLEIQNYLNNMHSNI